MGGEDKPPGLVAAVYRELDEAGRLDSIAGQLALQLAAKMVDYDVSGSAALSKEFRSVLAEALASANAGGGPEAGSPADDDELNEIARKRDEKRRAAAGEASA
jgi:hypothetical protein